MRTHSHILIKTWLRKSLLILTLKCLIQIQRPITNRIKRKNLNLLNLTYRTSNIRWPWWSHRAGWKTTSPAPTTRCVTTIANKSTPTTRRSWRSPPTSAKTQSTNRPTSMGKVRLTSPSGASVNTGRGTMAATSRQAGSRSQWPPTNLIIGIRRPRPECRTLRGKGSWTAQWRSNSTKNCSWTL